MFTLIGKHFMGVVFTKGGGVMQKAAPAATGATVPSLRLCWPWTRQSAGDGEYRLSSGKLSRSYCWERDTNRRFAPEPLLKITLQLQFFFEARVVNWSSETRSRAPQGTGIIVESVFQIGRELGYQQMVLHSVKYSMPFWLSLGFQPVAPINPLNPKTPRRMVCKL